MLNTRIINRCCSYAFVEKICFVAFVEKICLVAFVEKFCLIAFVEKIFLSFLPVSHVLEPDLDGPAQCTVHKSKTAKLDRFEKKKLFKAF